MLRGRNTLIVSEDEKKNYKKGQPPPPALNFFQQFLKEKNS